MKALDTNVLVRYLVQDDPAQGRKAASFIEGAATANEQILVSNIVLCETIWVLDSAYGYSKKEIEEVIGKLLLVATFCFENKDVINSAYEDYRSAAVDFADCLIGRLNASLGSEPTTTFDLALRRVPTFQML